MKKLVFLLICSQMMKICIAIRIKTEVIPGVNYYKVFYSLVNRESKNSGDVEECEEIEQGVLVEKINELEMFFENGYPTYGYCLDYYPIKVLKNLYNLNYKESYFIITDQFNSVSFSGEASFIGFHLNNFRYGLNLNSNKIYKVPDFELGVNWQAQLLDNEWVYTTDNSNRRVCDENFWVEYKVANVQEVDSKIKRFTIEWRGLRSYFGSLYYWDWYSKRHGRLVIDNDGTLQEFMINSPRLMKVFNYYDFADNKEIDNCLKIIKISKEEFHHLKPKIKS